ncbi:YdeI/OmpD-associated family protein [Streptomyces sp. NPDC060194]|uniref:YdeI/OmpD-associated family protein n=1 Tax=Streptomyces sp. NPDC060194 TaxID=3347069 RepID=UPI003653FA34
MGFSWPFLAEPHPIESLIEPMEWGRAHYTVVRMPQSLVDAAREAGTRRVAGRLEDVEVNCALTSAPVLSDTFVWAGAGLLRRLRLEAGDPVTGHLAPVDPDHVPVPSDLAEALSRRSLLDIWESLPPATRRRRLAAVETASAPATRLRRITALLDAL